MPEINPLSELIFPVIIGTLLFSAFVLAIILFIRQYHKTQQKFDWERQQHKQALLQTEVEIREQTLNSVSRELHDNIGQIASLIKINLNLVSSSLEENDRVKITESIELLKRLIGDIKALSLSLDNENIHRIGLYESIKQDIERVNRTGSLLIQFTGKNTLPLLRPDVEIFLYRICQEALNNILKHANASTAELTIDFMSETLEIIVRDNGRGFDMETVTSSNEKKHGSGLDNIKRRCSIIGASFSIETKYGAGTTIRITLPIKQNHNEKE
jgi:signal transduction histidine kinase